MGEVVHLEVLAKGDEAEVQRGMIVQLAVVAMLGSLAKEEGGRIYEVKERLEKEPGAYFRITTMNLARKARRKVSPSLTVGGT